MGSLFKHRSCDECGSRMAPFMPRTRLPSGELVCGGCSRKHAKVAGNAKCEFTHDGEAPPAQWRVYGPLDSDEMYAVCDQHRASAEKQFPGRSPKVEKIARASKMATIIGPRGAMQVIAHDSGDGETIYHCPFCGAGAIVGRSDGTAECQFCKTSFTVQVQPSRPAAPQTIDGQPHVHPDMPGTIPGTDPGSAPVDPAAQTGETTTPVNDPADDAKVYAALQNSDPNSREDHPYPDMGDYVVIADAIRRFIRAGIFSTYEEARRSGVVDLLHVDGIQSNLTTEQKVNEVLSSHGKSATRHFIAADGMAMREQQYLKHLAITHADNPAVLLAEMRAIRQESQ